MNKESKEEAIREAFPFLQSAEKAFLQHVSDVAVLKNIPKETTLFMEGDRCENVAFILSGVVRVYKLSESGREITLYRLTKGESCILTVSSILSRMHYPALAVAEEDLQVFLVPAARFREWVNNSECWRGYIFSLLSKRLSNVISTVEEIAFHRMDFRVAESLLHLEREGVVKRTHQEIAMDIGTSREVVSRILKDFERRGFLHLSRGVIRLKARENLQEMLKK